MLDMPVIGAKVPSKRRPPGGSPKPPDFPPPGIRLLPLKAKSRPAFPPPKACSKNKQGPQPPQSPPPEQLLQKEQMKRKQRLPEQPWIETQLELEAKRMELLKAKQLDLEARRMELLRAKSKLEEDAKTKDPKLVEEAAGEMRNTRQDELPKQVEQQLLCPSCQAPTLPRANFCGRCGVSLMGVIIIDDATSSSRDRCGVSLRALPSTRDRSRIVRRQGRQPPSDSV